MRTVSFCSNRSLRRGADMSAFDRLHEVRFAMHGDVRLSARVEVGTVQYTTHVSKNYSESARGKNEER